MTNVAERVQNEPKVTAICEKVYCYSFISWTGNIIQALYHLPEELKSNRRLCITTYENKEQFSVKVFKVKLTFFKERIHGFAIS